MTDSMIDWADVQSKQKVANVNDKRPSFETLQRINLKRDDIDSITFRPIHKPFLYLEYWNVDDPTNIRYGDNYYVVNQYYGRNIQRLLELGYSDAAPNKLRMRAIVSFLIFDRADGKLKIIELPWGASFLMGQFATKSGKNLGGKGGVDFTITDMSDDKTEKYAVDAGGDTPFTDAEKDILKEMLKDRFDGMADLYFRRFVDIEPMLKGLNIDPFDDTVEEPEPEPKAEIIITVPSMDDDKYKPIMKNMTDDVLKNLRALVNSKEYDRHLSQEIDEQERVNLDVFLIRTQIELEYRQNGLPFCERFVNKIRADYSNVIDLIDEDDYDLKLNKI
ncbi:MAG: hypothetical protein ACTSRU_17700 [Candidatus Hodarchaeales archaeon]